MAISETNNFQSAASNSRRKYNISMMNRQFTYTAHSVTLAQSLSRPILHFSQLIHYYEYFQRGNA